MAGFVSGNNLSYLALISLVVGIAIQNIPEGAIVSLPLYISTGKKSRSFLYGLFSGIVELIAAIVMFFLVKELNFLLPYFLSFAAGVMMYVVVEELIPESQTGKHSNLATIGLMVGFLLMMILDVALG